MNTNTEDTRIISRFAGEATEGRLVGKSKIAGEATEGRPVVKWCKESLGATLAKLNGDYEYAYISLGGKYNEPTVQFSNPAYLDSYDFPSNTQYQMFPMFMRFPKKGRGLILIVDCFDNDETLEINQKIIDRAVSQFPHLDVVIYDTTLCLKDVRPFAETVVSWVSSRKITPEKCLFANYIRFRGCNSIDTTQLEVAIPQKIQCVLNESKVYIGCLYQWFGFQYYTYNLLYSYRKYDMSRHLKVILLFHECAEATQVVSGNASNLFMFDLACEKANKNVLVAFLKNTLDITSYPKSGDTICSKMVDFCSRETIHIDLPTTLSTVVSPENVE